MWNCAGEQNISQYLELKSALSAYKCVARVSPTEKPDRGHACCDDKTHVWNYWFMFRNKSLAQSPGWLRCNSVQGGQRSQLVVIAEVLIAAAAAAVAATTRGGVGGADHRVGHILQLLRGDE